MINVDILEDDNKKKKKKKKIKFLCIELVNGKSNS